uniref:Endonuclease/exonuclease/phosphatase domain-containing protein n=1 Tax=Photinus pyralis TaxID=7054 RepID=A0A1Y1KKL8_PHOPY
MRKTLFQTILNCHTFLPLNKIPFNLIQWNCDGFHPRLGRLQQLISEHLPDILCLQETNFKELHSKFLKNFEGYHHLRSEYVRASGGTSIFVSSNLFSETFPITTNLEALAVSVWCPTKITICSIYIPPNHSLTAAEINTLIVQLPNPFILVGDFNAHNRIWGSEQTFGRGKIIEQVLNNDNLCLLNTGSHTHLNFATGNFSSIDLSFSDPITATAINWQVLDSLYDSNHYPIRIFDSIPKVNLSVTKWRISRTNWDLFSADVKTQTDQLEFSDNIDTATNQMVNCILTSAEKYIGEHEIKGTCRRANGH